MGQEGLSSRSRPEWERSRALQTRFGPWVIASSSPGRGRTLSGMSVKQGASEDCSVAASQAGKVTGIFLGFSSGFEGKEVLVSGLRLGEERS